MSRYVPLMIGRKVVATGARAQIEALVSALLDRAGTLPHTLVRRCDGNARLTYLPCASTAGKPCDCGQALHARILATARVPAVCDGCGRRHRSVPAVTVDGQPLLCSRCYRRVAAGDRLAIDHETEAERRGGAEPE